MSIQNRRTAKSSSSSESIESEVFQQAKFFRESSKAEGFGCSSPKQPLPKSKDLSTNLKNKLPQQFKEASSAVTTSSCSAPTATTSIEEKKSESVSSFHSAAYPAGIMLEIGFDRFNGDLYEEQNQALQDCWGVTASDAESLNFDQTPISLTAAADVAASYKDLLLTADPEVDLTFDLIFLPLSDIEIPVTAEQKVDWLHGRLHVGYDFLEKITSHEQQALELQIKQDESTQVLIQDTLFNECRERCHSVGIDLGDIPQVCVDREAVVAGILAELGLSFRCWYIHAADPKKIFDFIIDRLYSCYW